MEYTQNDLKPNRYIVTNYFDLWPNDIEMLERKKDIYYYRGDLFPKDYNTFVIIYSDNDYTLLSDNSPIEKGYYKGKETHYIKGYIIKTKTLLDQLNNPICKISNILYRIPNVKNLNNKQNLYLDKNENPKDMCFIKYNEYNKKYSVKYNIFDKNGIKSDTEFNNFIEKYNKIAAGKYAKWKNQIKNEQNGFSFFEERYPEEDEDFISPKKVIEDKLPKKEIKTTKTSTEIKAEKMGYYGDLFSPLYNEEQEKNNEKPKNDLSHKDNNKPIEYLGYCGCLVDPPPKMPRRKSQKSNADKIK